MKLLRENAGLSANQFVSHLTTLERKPYLSREREELTFSFEEAEEILAVLVADPEQREPYRYLPGFPAKTAASFIVDAQDHHAIPTSQQLSFGAFLDAFRRYRDLSRRELARAAGLSFDRLNRIATDETSPDVTETHRLVHELGAPDDWREFVRQGHVIASLLHRRAEEFGPALWTMRHPEGEVRMVTAALDLANAIGHTPAEIHAWEGHYQVPDTTVVRKVVAFFRHGTSERWADVGPEDEASFYDEAQRQRVRTRLEPHRPAAATEERRFADQVRSVLAAAQISHARFKAVVGSTGYARFVRLGDRPARDFTRDRASFSAAFGCTNLAQFEQLAGAAEHVNAVRGEVPKALRTLCDQLGVGRLAFYARCGFLPQNGPVTLDGSKGLRRETLDRVVSSLGYPDEEALLEAAGIEVDRESFERIRTCHMAIPGETPASGAEEGIWKTLALKGKSGGRRGK